MFSVYVLPKAEKELRGLPRQQQKRIVSALHALAKDPYVGKKLRGQYEGEWSLRVWPYRILYIIEKKIVKITVLRIVHRQGAYK